MQELIRGADGITNNAVIRVGEDFTVAQVLVRHVAQLGHRLALVLVEDTTEAFCIKSALDTAEHAALIINARGIVCAFNKPASFAKSPADFNSTQANGSPVSNGATRQSTGSFCGSPLTCKTPMSLPKRNVPADKANYLKEVLGWQLIEVVDSPAS